MCEECEYESCPCCRLLDRIEAWKAKVRGYFLRKYCSVKGHEFKVTSAMIYEYKDKPINREKCRCGLSRYVYRYGKPLTEEEMDDYIRRLFLSYLSEESRIYELLPKEVWKSE